MYTEKRKVVGSCYYCNRSVQVGLNQKIVGVREINADGTKGEISPTHKICRKFFEKEGYFPGKENPLYATVTGEHK